MSRTDRPELFTPKHTALIVVDMQHAFASEGGLVHRLGHSLTSSRAIIAPLQRLLHAARFAGVFVMFLQVNDGPRGFAVSAAERARRQHIGLPIDALPSDSPDAQIIPDLTPQPGEVVITKHRLCGFVGTELDMILRANGIHSIVVAGLQSHACVLSTAWLGVMHDYFVAVPEDCTASPTASLHHAAITLMRHSLHAVLSSQELIEIWHPHAAPTEPSLRSVSERSS